MIGLDPDTEAKVAYLRRSQLIHANTCYGTYPNCQSCGCNSTEGQACVSHKNNNSYLAHQVGRIADLLERKFS